MKRTFATIIFVVVVSACSDGTPQAPADDAQQAAQTAAPARAETVGGVQVIEIEAGSDGFSPDRIALDAGVPARLIFTRTFEASCIEHVSIPAFGVEQRALPLGEQQVIEFVPTEAGEFTFVCGMNMQEGSLIVATS